MRKNVVSNYQKLNDEFKEIDEAFKNGTSVDKLLKKRSQKVDAVICNIWSTLNIGNSASLVAVGGYGRASLHPYSDIDILILVGDDTAQLIYDKIELFIQDLWDLKLKIGHAVRDISHAIEACREDLSIITNIDESRFLVGDNTLYQKLMAATRKESMWPTKDYYHAKVIEQQIRHKRFAGTSFNLEPNIKSSPGGFRDVQVITWVANRHFDTSSLKGLAEKNVLTRNEFQQLLKCHRYLSKVRYALHLVSGRAEERLLFDHQAGVAEMLGYQDDHRLLAVEQMMKKFFACVMTIRNLNEMLIELFKEIVLEEFKTLQRQNLDDNFHLKGGKVGINTSSTFEEKPETILLIFWQMAKRSDIKGIRSSTLRSLRECRDLINHSYRQNKQHKQIFLDIFRQRHIAKTIVYMKRYGVLAKFIPAFEKITGQMQFDLFHLFTVDEHTLFLLKNISRYYRPIYESEYPFCSQFIKDYAKPEILYLAALFHDIAKGRGGDHSELGSEDAYVFCRDLNLSEEDSQLVSWLVLNHLTMSMIAQRQDITDPEVIHSFATRVVTQERLGLLYCLTVADIRATNINLWNSWKNTLLRELYLNTKRALERGLENPLQRADHIVSIKNQAIAICESKDISKEKVQQWWQILPDDYFVGFSPTQLAWHAKHLVKNIKSNGPLVKLINHSGMGSSELIVYLPDQPYIFAAITAILSQKSLNIQTADLYTTVNGYCFDSFILLEQDGKPIDTPARRQSIIKLVQRALESISVKNLTVHRRRKRQLKSFNVEPNVQFIGIENQQTQIQIDALDTPGLLAMIAFAFKKADVKIHAAKIVTLGERAEDVFAITDRHNQPIEKGAAFDKLRQTIIQVLKKGSKNK
jgi:[protein-PII] uridylyltransferase